MASPIGNFPSFSALYFLINSFSTSNLTSPPSKLDSLTAAFNSIQSLANPPKVFNACNAAYSLLAYLMPFKDCIVLPIGFTILKAPFNTFPVRVAFQNDLAS